MLGRDVLNGAANHIILLYTRGSTGFDGILGVLLRQETRLDLKIYINPKDLVLEELGAEFIFFIILLTRPIFPYRPLYIIA